MQVRSLWRMIAARWLGGQGSEVLTGDTGLLDLLTQGNRSETMAVTVRRQSGVSHRAMMSRQEPADPNLETVT